MYKKVVVALDGSDLAELTLPHLANLVVEPKAVTVYLVSVTEQIKGKVSRIWDAEDSSVREFHMAPDQRPQAIGTTYTGALFSSDSARLNNMPADLGRMAKAAYSYLSRKADDLAKIGLKADVRVLVGDPAEEIVNFASGEAADLIVMATSSKAGHGRWAPSVIAEKVTKKSDVPVLLIKPKPGFKETKPRRRGGAG
jgi:nucleotide-binding universal stress UspA family protein